VTIMQALVYAYGCQQPTRGLDAAMAEHERCADLWDELVQIDRDCEQQLLDAALADDDAIRERSDAIAACDVTTVAGRRGRAKLWREQRVAVRKWARGRPEAKTVEAHRIERVKRARQSSPAWWCNYNRVIQAYNAARSVCRQKNRRLRMHDHARDDGVLAVQIQRTRSGLGAAPCELMDGTTSALSIGAVPDAAYGDAVPRAQRRRQTRTVVEMRVDAAGNTMRLPVMLHRPLPGDARVKAAQVTWRRRAGRVRWQLCLTLSMPEPRAVAVPEEPTRLTLLWQPANDGLVVARCGDETLTLPSRWMDRLTRTEGWRGWLDESRERIRAAAPERWKVALQLSEHEMLDALLAHAREQPRRGRLPHGAQHDLELARAYADEAAARGDVLEWRRGWAYVHQARLATWRKLLLHRREMYRLWARRIVRLYPHIDIDDIDLSRVARQDRNTDENGMRQRAAPHTLRAEIVHQARKIGCRVVASGVVLTPSDDEKSSAWARRKAAKAERSQLEAQAIDSAAG